MSKKGKELTKCEVTLVDDSNCEITLTMWDKSATEAESKFAGNPVVAFKGLKLSNFGGKSMSYSFNSAMSVAPKMAEGVALRTWYDTTNGGANEPKKKLSGMGMGGGGVQDSFDKRKMVSAIRDESMGHNTKPDWVNFKGTINFIKKDKEGGPWYPACPNKDEPCRNMCKVTQTSDSYWTCERCQKQYDHCCRRYIFSLTIIDGSSSTWVSIFNDQAEALLGISAEELNVILAEKGDYDTFGAKFDEVLHSDWIFTCKVKSEEVAGETRVKTSIHAMAPVNYEKESKNLLDAIQALQ
jgi:replication factor A1